MSLVCLITDFGTDDTYVAEMKLALARLGGADLRWIDGTHAVAPGDIAAASWVLQRLWTQGKAGTVYLVVVDPGVGSSRPAVAARADARWFVGPGNGLAAFLRDRENLEVWHLDRAEAPPRLPVSTTFHGRDVFAPAAAHLASGGDPALLGRLAAARDLGPAPTDAPVDGLGRVVWIDRFGNLITDIVRGALADGTELMIAGRPVVGPVDCYAAAAPGDLIWYWGSQDTLEVAVRDGHAARRLGAEVGLVIGLAAT